MVRGSFDSLFPREFPRREPIERDSPFFPPPFLSFLLSFLSSLSLTLSPSPSTVLSSFSFLLSVSSLSLSLILHSLIVRIFDHTHVIGRALPFLDKYVYNTTYSSPLFFTHELVPSRASLCAAAAADRYCSAVFRGFRIAWKRANAPITTTLNPIEPIRISNFSLLVAARFEFEINSEERNERVDRKESGRRKDNCRSTVTLNCKEEERDESRGKVFRARNMSAKSHTSFFFAARIRYVI